MITRAHPRSEKRKRMRILKRLFLYTICTASAVTAGAQQSGADTAMQKVARYGDITYLGNVAMGSDNPVFISDTPVEQYSQIGVSYGMGKGGFHNIDESGDTRGLHVSAYGLKKLEKVAFEGGITYTNGAEDRRKWKTTLYLDQRNPFILADTVDSDYALEKFTVDGRFSWQILPFMRFGINAFYEVGVNSDEQDPRAEVKGMRFKVNPGFGFRLSDRLNLGVTGGVRIFNEGTAYTCAVTATTHRFLLMSGLGTYYQQAGNSYQRDTKGLQWDASLQLVWDAPGMANYVEAGVGSNSEENTDGGTSRQFLGGEFSSDFLFVKERFMYKKGRAVHNVELAGILYRNEGVWYDQKSVTSNGQSYWEVMNSSVKHKESAAEGSVAYRFDWLDGSCPLWSAGAKASLCYSDTYNYPDKYNMQYLTMLADVSASRHIAIKRSFLSLTLGGRYGRALSSDISVSGLELADKYTYPLFHYLTAQHYGIYGRAETRIAIRAKRLSSYIGVYVEASTDQYAGSTEPYSGTRFNKVRGGVNFSF